MKRTLFFACVFVAALLPAGAQEKKSFVRITNDARGSEKEPGDDYTFSFVNPNEPFTLTCECSPDVIAVTINRYTDKRRAALRDGYTLKKLKPGSTKFIYRLFPSLGNMDQGANYYHLSALCSSGISIDLYFSIYYTIMYAERAKPVIYLYPPRETLVSVKVSPREGVSRSIPAIGPGWRVRARPDGRLTDLGDGKDYPYLFWESPDSAPPQKITRGFVVKREELGAFFRGKLAYLGLKGAEIDDFCGFWLPIMRAHPYYAIRFAERGELDADAPLSVSPAPDCVIRVYFESEGLDGPESIPAQELHPASRSGFSLVEWGGRRIAE